MFFYLCNGQPVSTFFFLFVAKDIIFKFAKKYTFLRYAAINFLVQSYDHTGSWVSYKTFPRKPRFSSCGNIMTCPTL